MYARFTSLAKRQDLKVHASSCGILFKYLQTLISQHLQARQTHYQTDRCQDKHDNRQTL